MDKQKLFWGIAMLAVVGCSQPSTQDMSGGSSNGVVTIGAEYSGSLGNSGFSRHFFMASSPQERSFVSDNLSITGVSGTLSGCRNYASGSTLAVTFSGPGVANSITINGAAKKGMTVTQGDKSCSFSVNTLTLGTSPAYTYTVETGYSLVVTSSPSPNYTGVTPVTTNATGAPYGTLYVAASFSSNPGTEDLSFIYGEDEAYVDIASNSSPASPSGGASSTVSVSLSPGGGGGGGSSSPVLSPAYCIGSSTSGGSCDPSGSITSFALTYDANHNILAEELSLFLATGSQAGEKYMFINTGAALASSDPDTDSCGNISATGGLSNTTGCTYALIDSVFTAGTAVAMPTSSSGIVTVSTPANGTVIEWDDQTGSTDDFLGLSSGVPSSSSQSAVRYLIIQHTDSGSGTVSYQLLILNAGY